MVHSPLNHTVSQSNFKQLKFWHSLILVLENQQYIQIQHMMSAMHCKLVLQQRRFGYYSTLPCVFSEMEIKQAPTILLMQHDTSWTVNNPQLDQMYQKCNQTYSPNSSLLSHTNYNRKQPQFTTTYQHDLCYPLTVSQPCE